MAARARLVAGGGKWCVITPRSWMSGSYLRAVRRTIFVLLRPDARRTLERLVV